MDPHYFDSDLPKDILIKSICYFSNNELYDNNSENISYLLQQVGIMRDELSNYCYICHIDNVSCQWKEFYNSYEIWNMNMYNLNRVKTLFLKQKIYIIENPSVFQRICQYIQKNKINVGAICSNGQINLCTYQLLDKLLESGCELYYAGDFDPEGLYIADRLVTRYNLHLWCYDEKYFDMIKIEKKLTSRRMKILEQLKHPQPQKIARNIQIKKSVGYQEGLIDIYLNNI